MLAYFATFKWMPNVTEMSKFSPMYVLICFCKDLYLVVLFSFLFVVL